MYKSFENPLHGLTDEETNAVVRAIADHHTATYEDAFGELTAAVKSTEPLTVLSNFAAYCLTSFEGTSREWDENPPILQHHVELLQAVFLMAETASTASPANPRDLETLDKQVRAVSESFFMRRFGEIEGASKESVAKALIIEDMRGQTQAIRNWGYAHQIRRIVTEVFRPLEDEIEKAHGVRIEHLFEMHARFEEETTDRLNEHFRRVAPIWASRSVKDAVSAYVTAQTGTGMTEKKVHDVLLSGHASLTTAKAMLIAHYDLRLFECFTYSVDDWLGFYPVDIDRGVLIRHLDFWSHRFGDLGTVNPEHLFLGNPVWRRPMIKIGDETYFWPILALMYSYAWDLAEGLLPESAMERYFDTRSAYLEDETERLLRKAFPSGTVFRGSKWVDSETGVEYENDVLVVIDTFLLCVEAKSGRVKASARRGGVLSLTTEVRELLVEPSVQASRFGDFLMQDPAIHRFQTKSGVTNDVDTRRSLNSLPLVVTLDVLDFLGASTNLLREAGLVPAGTDLSVSMCVSDLEIVLDLLPDQAQRLHYLRRRAQLEKTLTYTGDEADLLALYMDTGFALGEMEEGDGYVNVAGLSTHALDRYYIGLENGLDVERPARRLTDRWRNCLQAFKARGTECWTDASYVLLHASFESQRRFEKAFRKTADSVRSGRIEPQFIATAFGPPKNCLGFAHLLYKDLDREERNRRGQVAMRAALDEPGAQQALLLGTDVSEEAVPYTFMALGPAKVFEKARPIA